MSVDSREAGAPAGDQPSSESRRGESRWPMAVAILVAGALHASLPKEVSVFDVPFVMPLLLVALLAAVILADPGRIDRRSLWSRLLTEFLIGVLAIANGVAVVKLVNGILFTAQFNNAVHLLGSGASLWLTNVIAFALWYWDLDRGGAAARASGSRVLPAFVFPEMENPQYVEQGWYPRFIDYLQLAFGTATAFSPTDVSPIRHWSKVLMMTEEAICLAIAVLVVARAVNIMQ